MDRAAVHAFLIRKARHYQAAGAAEDQSELAYVHYDEQGRFERAAELVKVDAQILADCETRIRGERELIVRCESRPDGTIPDDVARAEVAELDALLKRIKAAIMATEVPG